MWVEELLIKRIKTRNVPTKMLVLSMSDESPYAERVRRAEAALSKGCLRNVLQLFSRGTVIS